MTVMTDQPITLTEYQKSIIDGYLAEKVVESERENWRHHIKASSDNYHRALSKLRQMPYLPEHQRPQREGLYMDPETHKLYRVTKKGWDHVVSTYSETPALRLVQDTNQVVKKGTWKRLNSWDSRRTYDKLREVWYMTDEMKVQYQTGICNFCYRGLVDARSVYHNYGEVCAENHGLPWGDLPAGEG